MSEKSPYDYGKVYYARAPGQAAWLKVVKADPAEYATTSDFSQATPFDDEKTIKAAWAKLRADLIKKGAALAWLNGASDPVLFTGVNPAAPPGRIQAFLGMSQGRFVGEEGAGISRRWVMVTALDKASVFTTQQAAMYALGSALPARGVVTASILPLDCAAMAPMSYKDAPADPLAGALAAESARFELAGSVPEATVETKRSPSRVRNGL